MSRIEIESTRSEDAGNFHIGMYVEFPVPSTRFGRAREWLARKWRCATRWWRPRFVVLATDAAFGRITLSTERWSWRRWRWERR